jgi:dTDP-4-dehydrorhamnose 3,5-epimerase
MSRFEFFNTSITDLKIVKRLLIGDQRGFLSRLFCQEELLTIGWNKPIVQINQTFTKKRGTVRGMHFQHPPHAEMKLVMCLRGAIWDIAVDLRAESPTFLQWYGVELSGENQKALLIPEGFAHGFQTLSDDCELLYFHSAVYMSSSEAGLNPKDPKLSIAWPLDISELSERDQQHPLLDQQFKGLKP